jgi:hypothetical protein
MKTSASIFIPFVLLATMLLVPARAQTATDTDPAAASSMEKKLQRIVSNGKSARPDSSPTTISDQEVNSYFATGKVKLPAGVQSVSFQTQPGMIGASAQVNFDQIKGGRNSGNPLLSMFSGVHTVVVVAHAHGEGGQGFVHVDSVILDDNEIPAIILQLFVQKFVQPKYPNIGIDSKFSLPDRVDSAAIGQQKLTLIQK